jgi:WD40 repeat protein
MQNKNDTIKIQEETSHCEQKMNKNNQINAILRIKEIIRTDKLVKNLNISSLTELEDKRIACGGGDGSISINLFNIEEKTWVREIYNQNAHDNDVLSICVINDNKLLSGGDDCIIKVWNISKFDIFLIKCLNIHKGAVYKLIPLTKKHFASCSWDANVLIWESNNGYNLF